MLLQYAHALTDGKGRALQVVHRDVTPGNILISRNGAVLLAEGVRIEADAVIVGPASIGARSTIGARAVVTRSFVWDDCIIGEDAIVDASVLADRCSVVAGDRLRGVTQIPEDTSAVPETTPMPPAWATARANRQFDTPTPMPPWMTAGSWRARSTRESADVMGLLIEDGPADLVGLFFTGTGGATLILLFLLLDGPALLVHLALPFGEGGRCAFAHKSIPYARCVQRRRHPQTPATKQR
jgi:hypothetical protein